MATPSHLRLDVQGLRAVAVLLVVAFHAGLPVPGGFVGVDVFFVVSGFVIAGMLLREREQTGRSRFGAFYVRRFKRLTPALAVVVAATALFSSLVLSPLGPQQTAAETGLGAMLLAANAVIATSTGGYFDAPAETNPLLHTWTLSVEEQFYLVFPALLALGWLLARRGRRATRAPVLLVGLVAVASFALADLGTAGDAGSWLLGFYSPLTRAWEFAAGALLALLAPRLRVPVAAGLALLAASVVLIDSGTPFPGAWTLLPVGAAVLLILSRSRVLAARPLVWVGDRSYSIYLWHWPFVVFASLLWPETASAPALAAAASLLPAAASYRFVEQPFRRLELPAPRLAALAAAVVLVPALLAAGVGSAASRFWTPRYEAGAIAVANEGDIGQDVWHRYLRDAFHPCTPRQLRERALTWHGVLRCQQSRPGADVSVAVIGDSHAEHLFLGLAEALPARNVAYYVRNDPPSMADPEVARIVRHVAASPSIDTVVVSALWNLRGVRDGGLPETLATLARAGKALFVTDDVPYFPFEPFGCKYRRALLLPTDCSMDAAAFRRDYALYFPELRDEVARVPGARLLRTARYFCDGATCDMSRGGKLLFRDRGHLNANGSRFFAQRLLSDYPELAQAQS